MIIKIFLSSVAVQHVLFLAMKGLQHSFENVRTQMCVIRVKTSLLSYHISVITWSCSSSVAFEEALGGGEVLASTSRKPREGASEMQLQFLCLDLRSWRLIDCASVKKKAFVG